MIASWWDAHALEFVVWGGLSIALGVSWTVWALHDAAWRERAKKKRDGLL